MVQPIQGWFRRFRGENSSLLMSQSQHMIYQFCCRGKLQQYEGKDDIWCRGKTIDALVGLLFVLGVVIGMVDGEGKVGLGRLKHTTIWLTSP